MIEVNGTLFDFCKDCPYMQLQVVGYTNADKIYDCENSGLCSRLWEFLKNKLPDAKK